MVSDSDKTGEGKKPSEDAGKHVLLHDGKTGQVKNSWNDRWGNNWYHVEHSDGSTGRYRENHINTMRNEGAFSQAEMEAQRKMYEETQKKLDNLKKTEEKGKSEIESELNKKTSATNVAADAAGAAAPEAKPIIDWLSKYKNNRDAKKAEKREARLADKRAQQESSLAKKQADLMSKQSRAVGKDENHSAVVLLFLLAIIAHIIDWRNDFARPPVFVVMAFWLVIMISHFFFISERHFDGDQNTLFGVIALVIVLPILIRYLLDSVRNEFVIMIAVILLFFPPLVLYLIFKFPAGAKFGKWYLYMWILIVTLLLITSSAAREAFDSSKSMYSESESAMSVNKLLDNIGAGLDNMKKELSNTWSRGLNYALGQQYDGDEESRVGIFISDVRPVENEYYPTSDVYIQGKISAENIKETVSITTGCMVPDTNITGTTYPDKLQLVNNAENTIDCHLGRFAPGSFEVKLTSTFTFKTEAKINYYFIDSNRRPESYTKTKIPKKSMAIYTGGPVELGLPSLNQPLRISVEGKSNLIGDYPFGISLTNKWSDGKVIRGINYTLDVPDSIELYACNKKPKQDVKQNTPGRRMYIFIPNTANLKEAYDSVSCRMRILDSKKLLGSDIERAPEVTFKGTAIYDYGIEGSTYVNVLNDGTVNIE